MFKNFILSTLLISYLATVAQTNFHFADSTAEWTLCHRTFSEGSQGSSTTYQTDVYIADGDTFFNNKNYQKIVSGYPNYDFPLALVRKDSLSKVFLYDPNISSDRMIYDFSLNQGDTMRIYQPASWHEDEDTIKFVVDSTDYVTFGIERKRIFLRCITGTYCSWFTNDIIIEGIGTLNSHFLSPYIYEFLAIPGDAFNILDFQENGTNHNFSSDCSTVSISKVASEKIKIYPNPADYYLNVTGLTSETTFYLYNLFGQEVLKKELQQGDTQIEIKNLTNGIYVYRVFGVSNAGKVLIKK